MTYMDCGVPAGGLRERKKAETREAISRAAVRLALEHGLENVRVADIAVQADVSPRTYNNYFASIAEAVCAGLSDRALALAEAVRRRPADEPLDEAIANAIIALHTGAEIDRPLVRMITGSPELRGEFFKAVFAREAALTEVIAERTGAEPGDLYPQVLAATISGVTRVVTHRWLHDDTSDFAELLWTALALVAPMARALTVEPPSADRKIVGPDPAAHTRL